MALTKAKLIELFDSGQLDDYMGGGALGNITADGKVGTTADLTLMTGTGGLVVARTMAEAIQIWKFTNPNLLHNWDFRTPVNQRGVSGEISTGTYFYDRWIRISGTVTTNAAYLTIGATAEIEQRIEGNLLAGAIVTVSVMAGGTVYSGTGTMPTSAGTASLTLTGWGTATLGYATGYMYVRLSPTAASNIQAVKLELGTVSTLAYDQPMDYGVELAKCQRYYRTYPVGAEYKTFLLGLVDSASLSFFPFLLHTPMRIGPSIIVIGTFNASSITVSSASPTFVMLQNNLGGSPGAFTTLYSTSANAALHFSADL